MQVFSDFPVGWKMVISTVQGVIIFAGWKMGAPDTILEIMAGLFGLGTVAKMVTDRVKILATNGNGKPPVPVNTTGAADSRGAS